MALEAWFFAKMRRDGIDLDCLGANETDSCLFIPVHPAQPWTEVAIPEVRIGLGPLSCSVKGRYEMVAGDVVVEEERRGKIELAA